MLLNEIRRLINIISEMEINDNKKKFDLLYNENVLIIYDMFNEYSKITEEYKKPAILVFNTSDLLETQEVINELYENNINHYLNDTQIYKVIDRLKRYFVDGEFNFDE